MKMMTNFLLMIVLLLYVSCSYNPSAGGGSDLPDMKIAQGIIYKENSSPAPNTVVMLIPAEYNAVKDGPIPDSLTDTTDSLGSYHFKTADLSIYNMQAFHLFEGTKSFIPDIVLQEDTTFIKQAIIKPVGVLTIILPATVDTVNGYVYIKGTTESKRLSESVPLDDGGYSITFDSVPEATFTHILYDILGDPVEPKLISDTISVISNDTSVSEAFTFWTQYTETNSGLPGNEARSICLLPDGGMWLGTLAGVASFSSSQWSTYTMANSGLPDDYVFDIKRDRNGTIWFATFGGLASFDGNSWRTYNTANSPIPSDELTTIVIDKTNTLWLATYGGGLVRFDRTSWTIFDTLNSLIPSNNLNYIYQDEYDNLWVGTTQNGLAKFDGLTWTTYNINNSNIPYNSIYSIATDDNGDLWVGYCQGGVSKFDGATWTYYYINTSPLLYDPVYTIMKDSHGNLWFGTGSGLIKYNYTKWVDYNGEKYKLLHNKGVFIVTIDTDDNKWVGTLKDGVIAFGPTIK